MIQEVRHNNQLLAIIISSSFSEPGIHFFTPDDFSQQLAFMKHPVGKVILPHVHNSVQRQVHYTKETLFIRKGKIRVDFYTDQQEYFKSYILETGDVILLSEGGHGFEMLEETEMIEVKQGPYSGEKDKTRFEPVVLELIKCNENE
jgi:mannose-6-phosphate isomerase-like protein (cupin superfamily)